MDAPSRRARRGTTAVALAWFAMPALAVGLGEIDVRSPQGAPLEARIPIAISGGEAVHAACFSVGRTDVPANAVWPEAALELRRSAHGAQLLVRSLVPLNQPTIGLRVAFGCAGEHEGRDYAIALALPGARSPVDMVAQLPARPGDTLAGIAQAIFPRDGAARRDYLRALRSANGERGADEAIASGISIALPDLRHFARTHAAEPPVTRHVATAPSPRIDRPTSERAAAHRVVHFAPARLAHTAATAPANETLKPPPRAARAAPRDEGFALKLSGPVLDLSPSHSIGERERATLRERLRALDADDAMAAMLALRHEVAQLQARVSELQLKLASMPAATPNAPAQKAAVSEPFENAANAATAAPVASAPPHEAQPTTQGKTPTPPTARSSPAPARPVAAQAHRFAATAASEPIMERVMTGLQSPRLVVGLGGTVLLLLGLWLAARARGTDPADTEGASPDAGASSIEAAEAGFEAEARDEPPARSAEALPQPPREDQEETRRRYIAERFPEVASGAIDLDDADAVVKGARLFYEGGSALPAMELLQLAIERRPGEAAPWLALFEIYRRERLTSAFAELAVRFREQHGERPEWRKVCYFGASIDPDNALYREEATADGIESLDLTPDMPPDPGTEDWLQAGASQEQELLAQRLRASVMAAAAVREEDLAPNPIPALRAVEIFNVA